MPSVRCNDINIHYHSTGAGSALVLIHGLASNLGFWYPEIVRDLNVSFKVVAYDLRGHGHSQVVSTGYAPQDMARDLLLLMDHLEIKKAHVAGHSFGGAVAFQLCLSFPSLV